MAISGALELQLDYSEFEPFENEARYVSNKEKLDKIFNLWLERVDTSHDYSELELELNETINDPEYINRQLAINTGQVLLEGFVVMSANSNIERIEDTNEIMKIGRKSIEKSIFVQLQEGPDIILQKVRDNLDKSFIEYSNDAELDLSVDSVNEEAIFDKIFSHPLLSRNQEVELSKKIEKGDLDAKQLLIESNLRLVASIAFKTFSPYFTKADIFQVGVEGLIRAAEKFDHRKGFRFSTYASIWIKQSIQRGIANHGNINRIPVHRIQQYKKLQSLQRENENETGKVVNLEEFAEYIRLDRREVRKLIQFQSLISLDTPFGENDASLIDFIPENRDEISELIDNSGFAKELLSTLTDEEKTIVTLKLGLYDDQERSYRSIRQITGINEKKLMEIFNGAMEKLKNSPLAISINNQTVRREVKESDDYVFTL